MSGPLPTLILYALMVWTGINLILLSTQELTQLLKDLSMATRPRVS